MTVTADYDSLVSKIIAWDNDRKTAINRLQRGLMEYQIGGLKTDLVFLNQILESHPYQSGEITTSFLDDFIPEDQVLNESITRDAAVAAALHIHQKRNQPKFSRDQDGNLWQQTAWREQISPGT